MKAVVIGPGRIGCGFAGQLLHDSGYDLTFVGRNREVVDHLNQHGGYQVRLVEGAPVSSHEVTGIDALPMEDRRAVARSIAEADVVVTAVGARALITVAPLIADGLALGRGPGPAVLAFENLSDAGERLERLVSIHDPAAASRAGYSGVVVSRAVSRRLGRPGGNAPFAFIGDSSSTFVVDGSRLRSPLPKIDGLVAADDFDLRVLHKLYTFNAGHAAAAYLGHLKGYKYIHAAVRDHEIRAVVRGAIVEARSALEGRFGAGAGSCGTSLERTLERFGNAGLNDTVLRVGRDPRRKLGPRDRLIGPARLGLAGGMLPENLSLAAAAALLFSPPSDVGATLLRRKVARTGIGAVLRQVCGLDVRHGMGHLVSERWSRLAAGWAAGNQLLSLQSARWAWAS
ncbi:MAG: 2-dehydropantoate 2-reductase N-terminal domain-containing protein [Acidimicrobiia bacterium]